jgi:hypothetical protein
MKDWHHYYDKIDNAFTGNVIGKAMVTAALLVVADYLNGIWGELNEQSKMKK